MSAPNILTGADIAAMAADAIVFALANPDPEVDPDAASEHAAVVATGRSDYPNQINNVLAFPGVFRGLLDAQSRTITDDMLVAAARALAGVVSPAELGPHYIIPSVFHPTWPRRWPPRSGTRRAAPVGPRALTEHPAHKRRVRSGAIAPAIGQNGDMEEDTLAGRLLVATPLLGDPNFRRSVVLVVEDEPEEGTLGVVLNRPTEIPVGQVLESWTDLVTRPSVVFRGGPVAPNSALGLAIVPGRGRAGRAGGRWTAQRCAPASAWSTWTPRRSCWRAASPRCGCSRATRAGARASCRRRSRRGPGTCCPASRPTRSPPSRSGSGRRCCAGPGGDPGPGGDVSG